MLLRRYLLWLILERWSSFYTDNSLKTLQQFKVKLSSSTIFFKFWSVFPWDWRGLTRVAAYTEAPCFTKISAMPTCPSCATRCSGVNPLWGQPDAKDKGQIHQIQNKSNPNKKTKYASSSLSHTSFNHLYVSCLVSKVNIGLFGDEERNHVGPSFLWG